MIPDIFKITSKLPNIDKTVADLQNLKTTIDSILEYVKIVEDEILKLKSEMIDLLKKHNQLLVDKCVKDKTYLDEVKKCDILDELIRIKKYSITLHDVIEKSNHLDNETKQNIINLKENAYNIYIQELTKELKQQKKDGKEFLSSDDVDNIINEIIKEEQ